MVTSSFILSSFAGIFISLILFCACSTLADPSIRVFALDDVEMIPLLLPGNFGKIAEEAEKNPGIRNAVQSAITALDCRLLL